MRSPIVASVADYREAARRRLPHFLFEYIDGGSYGEVSRAENHSALQDVKLRQRVLCDISSIELSTNLLGRHWRMPVALAPIGLAGMNARRGEVQAAVVADRADIPFCLSTVSVCPIAEVGTAVRQPFWFQLYMIRDRSFMRDLLAQAREAGCDTLVFTVDMPVPGMRYRDYRSGLAGASGALGSMRRFAQALARPAWAWDVGVRGRPHQLGNVAPVLGPKSGLEDFFAWMRDNFDPTVTWADLEQVRDHWDGKLVVKGILDTEDAMAAAAVGADGIVVSNHGGRQLDGVPATANALPQIAQALGGRIALLADGGVMSGLDVLRMIALGADAVLVGRAWAFALAAAGGRGVSHVLELIEAELRVAMALTGNVNIRAIDANSLISPGRAKRRCKGIRSAKRS